MVKVNVIIKLYRIGCYYKVLVKLLIVIKFLRIYFRELREMLRLN